jgi:hypothetical protein
MVVAMTAISEIDLFAALSAEGDLVSFTPPLCCLWCQIASPMFRHFNSDCDRGSPLLTCSTLVLISCAGFVFGYLWPWVLLRRMQC